MGISMVGLDFTRAGVQEREAFSPSAAVRRELLKSIAADPGLDGCVFISTCNRSELYLSHLDHVQPDGVALLCQALGLNPDPVRRLFVHRHEREAFLHLMRVASGMAASVLGDGQIVTQVRTALEEAREAGSADAELETLFRSAVTAGKKVKTTVLFEHAGASVADVAVRRLAETFGGLSGKKALVIGNGVIGRLAAETLRDRGAEVAMTLRAEKFGRTPPPESCRLVPYEDRYRLLAERDIVVSATTSPHFTLEAGALAGATVGLPDTEAKLDRGGLWIVDLAVPRDIDPEVGKLPGVTLWNVDDLRNAADPTVNALRLLEAERILEGEAKRFEAWRENRGRRRRRRGGMPNFPIFINVDGVKVLMVGGGKIAARRTGALLRFGAKVRVVAPAIGPEMEKLLRNSAKGTEVNGGTVEWHLGVYRPEDLAGATLAIAAADDREVNRRVGMDAKARGILVSVADRQEECSFFFPALIEGEVLTAGLISKNGDHALVKKAAVEIREELEKIEQDLSGGRAGEPAGGDSGGTNHGCDTAEPSGFAS